MTNIFDRMSSEESEPNDAPKLEAPEYVDAEPTEPTEYSEQADPFDSPKPPEGDSHRTPEEVRTAVQELLKHGFFEEGNRRELFRSIIIHTDAINRVLEPLDLILRIDTHRGIAFIAVTQEVTENQTETTGWSHPLVRKQRLTLEQSLLIAILRQFFIRHEHDHGVGQSDAKVSVEELVANFKNYFEETGSDAKDESKVLHLLDQLKTYGIVSEVDKKQDVVIRPLIAHLANPESLTTLLKVLKERRNGVMLAEESE